MLNPTSPAEDQHGGSGRPATDRADAPSGHGQRAIIPKARRPWVVLTAVSLTLVAAAYAAHRGGPRQDPSAAPALEAGHGGAASPGTAMAGRSEAERAGGSAAPGPPVASTPNTAPRVATSVAAAGGGQSPARDATEPSTALGSSRSVAAPSTAEAVTTPPSSPSGDARSGPLSAPTGPDPLRDPASAAVRFAPTPADGEPQAPEDKRGDGTRPALPAKEEPRVVAPALVPSAGEATPPAGAVGAAPIGTLPVPAATPAPAAAPALVPSARRHDAGRYAIQVAAERDPSGVGTEWRRLQRRHPSLARLKPRPPQRVDLPGQGTFYRVLAGAFRTRAEAQAACKELRARGQGCRVVRP